MKRKTLLYVMLTIFALGLLLNSCTKDLTFDEPVKGDLAFKTVGLTPLEQLGKSIFFDENLSANQNMSCASCHDPSVGFTGPDSFINLHGSVYEGSTPGRFGDRKPPTAAYGGGSPILYSDKGTWTGGMFWDGRATGWRLGSPLAEQAQGPFLNPMEHDLQSAADVIAIIRNADYAELFELVYGEGSLNGDVSAAYNNVGYAIAAYERSSEVSPFTSKYDYSLNGTDKLTSQEKLGKALFQGKAKCSKCHIIKGKQPLFTDFTYDNLGIPKNPENPFLLSNPGWADPGLGGFLNAIGDPTATANIGKHKVPTLRNVDMRPYPGFIKAYGHNGYFKSLEEIVHFYNTRDVPGEGWNGVPWPAPEVLTNMNTSELGNLKLSANEENAIVAFMKTLSDGYVPN